MFSNPSTRGGRRQVERSRFFFTELTPLPVMRGESMQKGERADEQQECLVSCAIGKLASYPMNPCFAESFLLIAFLNDPSVPGGIENMHRGPTVDE
jgi:hypothetical protein